VCFTLFFILAAFGSGCSEDAVNEFVDLLETLRKGKREVLSVNSV
jgi:hypothetical protein